MREEITEFGKVFYYDFPNYHFALYIYDDDDETIYLSNVKVDAEARGKGFGNKILEIAEREARKRNVSIICLKCLITSWVHNWYKKHGFEDLSLDVDEDYIWMKKELD